MDQQKWLVTPTLDRPRPPKNTAPKDIEAEAQLDAIDN